MRSAGDILGGFLALPWADSAHILGSGRAMILAPHPDDESLGCGGLIAAATATGNAPVVVVLTDGAASHPGSRDYPPMKLRKLREAEAARATCLLGLPADNLHFLRYEDSRLPAAGDEFEAIIATLLEMAAVRQCAAIIGPWAGDPHCDHQAAAGIADEVARRGGLRLLSYPVWGWLRDETDLLEEPRQGGWRLDISAQLAVKQQAIAAHQSQYGGLISDSSEGFQLPANLLDIFARPFEVFIA